MTHAEPARPAVLVPQSMVDAYLEAADFTTSREPEEEVPSGFDEKTMTIVGWTPAMRKSARRACETFVAQMEQHADVPGVLGILLEANVGHDLWLTRNGHGAGFWDGDYDQHGDEAVRIATDIAHGMGVVDTSLVIQKGRWVVDNANPSNIDEARGYPSNIDEVTGERIGNPWVPPLPASRGPERFPTGTEVEVEETLMSAPDGQQPTKRWSRGVVVGHSDGVGVAGERIRLTLVTRHGAKHPFDGPMAFSGGQIRRANDRRENPNGIPSKVELKRHAELVKAIDAFVDELGGRKMPPRWGAQDWSVNVLPSRDWESVARPSGMSMDEHCGPLATRSSIDWHISVHQPRGTERRGAPVSLAAFTRFDGKTPSDEKIVRDIIRAVYPGQQPNFSGKLNGHGFRSIDEAIRFLRKVNEGIDSVVARNAQARLGNPVGEPECNHTKNDSWWEHDFQGIPLCRVCDRCRERKLSRYRPEILSGYNQSDVDEPIDD